LATALPVTLCRNELLPEIDSVMSVLCTLITLSISGFFILVLTSSPRTQTAYLDHFSPK